ncbi:energy-coupling factor transporter transmembrane protein EcfT [Agaribacter marinus]|uniref:Energy-coupling factor transporter transmembrane protein EcfT n=1 Tax=Virgibacillus salarius TaxID=447199 RepID=A0A941DQH7_9BACI|nr:energy-coupling factor transporter transmembrane component T [Virgibacillus salarius]MBR7794750.1 energy-coupling factor transporter transmembrane protein EcfT [Virgibacillus salarius]NAZ07470.1 energy-coupling factor transporter transmembrane protein EcfT [Agaribacter marinus]
MTSLLNQLNPSIKAFTVILLVCLLTFVFDPFTPLVYCLFTILLTFVCGKIAWKRYMLYFLIIILLSVGMLWTTLAFADEPNRPHDTMEILFWDIPKEDVTVALALTLRMLAFASLSFMFIFTTNMVHFILSLMQQCKLSPKLAYGVLAGYRFLPLMKDELNQIRAAHQIRGVRRANGIKESIQQYKRYAIPLLAGAIRKAERTAVAMESKGFSGERQRTFYRTFTVKWQDWTFLVGMLLLFFIIIMISIKLGCFSWYKGQF